MPQSTQHAAVSVEQRVHGQLPLHPATASHDRGHVVGMKQVMHPDCCSWSTHWQVLPMLRAHDYHAR